MKFYKLFRFAVPTGVLLFCVLFLSACGRKSNEDVVAVPNKDGSIETLFHIEHANGYDLLTTTYKIWVAGQLDTQYKRTDTLRQLGTASGSSTPKDYEFYITVQ
ncbi:MAG: hypothetical protein IPL35_14610 [Sphingobacteriales bacterium]|nr:hypothetical protein [Sphingobacteriales bacterium]